MNMDKASGYINSLTLLKRESGCIGKTLFRLL